MGVATMKRVPVDVSMTNLDRCVRRIVQDVIQCMARALPLGYNAADDICKKSNGTPFVSLA
ncbi:hypothetical protein GCM10007418_25290 [Halopseudomonas salina]|uniref:Uncharacterized protein n=1 Tax=Halopseudomonas salina TaxID=1323744 RepID=A0ABQ1PVL9_9GAMM|nr:hypothetical protein GCM10007418_25290 [Halopseudomonas salina]